HLRPKSPSPASGPLCHTSERQQGQAGNAPFHAPCSPGSNGTPPRRSTVGARSIAMTSPTPPPRLTSRLSSLAAQLGLGGKAARRMLDRARQLNLPFQPIPLPTLSIWWQLGPQLERLVDLPRGALSGPVQEDKAAAHAVLARLLEVNHRFVPAFDL